MRKVIFTINLTVDGCCDHTKVTAGDEVHDYFSNLLRDTDTLIYGRKTYQLMVPFWPHIAKTQSGQTEAINEFAQVFSSIGKIIVFSKSLNTGITQSTKIIHSNLRDEIQKLKKEPGKSILTGGVNIPSQLIQLGLIDEFHFVIHPIVAGEGTRLFDAIYLKERLQLKLLEPKIFESGCVALQYVRP